MQISRRDLLLSTSGLAMLEGFRGAAAHAVGPIRAHAVPLSAVRLKPSIWKTATDTNRNYLLSLDPDRLLHNFRKGAGLPPKAPRYGGWEDQGIAGHTLGHYLTALSLMYAQTGDPETRRRVRYIVAELAATQLAHGDGYVGGTTVTRDGKEIDGKIVYHEVRRGDIRAAPFDLNGGWVPLYTWHKVHAGLIDAISIAHVQEALPVLTAMSDHLAGVLEPLSEEQMQKLLQSEHGGLNESFANAYALTGNRRYLVLAERIRHRAVLDPLAQGRDQLSGLHANTQIPKVIGLARLHELSGNAQHASAARFFHDRVTRHHSYVIGGNSEREFFGEAGKLSNRLSDRTCEHCNTYNMLKLTRHLYSWSPHASWFDYYERAHLNHVMAAQHPETGMFVYYMPLASGAKRTYSTPDSVFWCCVGSGMESHAKHGDSIYWRGTDTLFVNLFIPSSLDLSQEGLALELDSEFPFGDEIVLTVAKAPARLWSMALRLPNWATGAALQVNGSPVQFTAANGYAVVKRRWSKGDRVTLRLPMQLQVEPMPDNPALVAFSHGPVVLAADLEGSTPVWHGPTPGLRSVAGTALEKVHGRKHIFRAPDGLPAALTLRPFFSQYDRRTAVYFPRYSEATWQRELQAHRMAESERAALEARTIDVMQPGEFDQEKAHALTTNHSEYWSYAGRGMRDAWWGPGNFVEASMAVRSGSNVLRVLYWGEDVKKDFVIIVDGRELAHEKRDTAPEKRFVAVEYPLSPALTARKDNIRVRFETRGTDAPFYELRVVTPEEQERGPE